MRAGALAVLCFRAARRLWPQRVSRRAFSATCRRRDTYGFIGIGAMGSPMACNLQRSLDPVDALLIHDVNPTAVKRFCTEQDTASGGARIEAVESAREAAQRSVSSYPPDDRASLRFHDEFLLSKCFKTGMICHDSKHKKPIL